MKRLLWRVLSVLAGLAAGILAFVAVQATLGVLLGVGIGFGVLPEWLLAGVTSLLMIAVSLTTGVWAGVRISRWMMSRGGSLEG